MAINLTLQKYDLFLMMFNVKASKQKLSKALYATIESVQFHLDLETHRDDRMIATVIDDCLDNELDDSKSDHSNMSESPAIKNATRTSNTNLDNQSLVRLDISVNSSHDNGSSLDTNTDLDLSDDDIYIYENGVEHIGVTMLLSDRIQSSWETYNKKLESGKLFRGQLLWPEDGADDNEVATTEKDSWIDLKGQESRMTLRSSEFKHFISL